MIVTGNTATGGTGGASATATAGDGGKAVGGIMNSDFSSLTMTGSTISANVAVGGTGGVGTNHSGGAGGYAVGGFYDVPAAPTVVQASTISGNAAAGGAGGSASGSSNVGGLGGSATGGIAHVDAPLTLAATTIAGNLATGGVGGTASGSADGGVGGRVTGGGADVGGTATIVNSTIAGNAALGGAGGGASGSGTDGQGNAALGGGVYLDEASSLTLASNTLADNSAAAAANPLQQPTGGNLYRGNTDALITANDTIVAGGVAAGNTGNCDGLGGSGLAVTTDDGHNLSGASSQCGFSAVHGDLVAADPLLQPLASNGGPTQTMALGAGSPAIGAGGVCPDPMTAARLTGDQRSQPRANPCDIGAFQAQLPANIVLPQIAGAAQVGKTLSCSQGSWTGDFLSFARQWLRGGTAIAGATAPDYAVQGTDVGALLACTVTATGAYGSASATSAGVLASAAPALASAAPPPWPSISAVGERNKTWREGGKLATLARRKKPPLGTTFSFTLNTPATVKLVFSQTVAGRKVGHKCVAPTHFNRHKHTCTRVITAGSLTFTNTHAGLNKIAFQGRLSHSKKLKPGRYALKLTATNASGHTTSKPITFTIVKR